MIIYKTSNLINNKFYIGQDSHENPKYLGSGTLLKRAIKKYGLKNFQKDIIENNIKTYDILNEKEKYWISYYKKLYPDLCYNIKPGGAQSYFSKTHCENIGLSVKKRGNPHKNHEVIINTKHYKSVKEASESLMINYKTIISRINIKNNYSLWYYADEPKTFIKNEIHGKAAGASKANVKEYICPVCNKKGKGNGFKGKHFNNCNNDHSLSAETKLKISNTLKSKSIL